MKHTAEQIENLRRVLIGILGPIAVIAPAEVVDGWGNKIQEEIDRRYVSMWRLKIKHNGDKSDWSDIVPGPLIQTCSMNRLVSRCLDMMSKYPGIDAIMICDQVNDKEKPRIIER